MEHLPEQTDFSEFVQPLIKNCDQKVKNKLTWLIWLAVIGGGAWGLIYSHQANVREQRAAEIRQQQTDASIAALALKYNAVTNWESSLPDRGGAQPFSFEVLRALYGSNQQAVLIKCNVNDIFLNTDDTNNVKFIVSLSSADTTNNLSLELQCSPVQAATFASTNQISSFAAVFKCQDAKRLSGDNEGFLVKGELLEAIQLPEHFVSEDESSQQTEPDAPQ